jgi:hypothetical protein
VKWELVANCAGRGTDELNFHVKPSLVAQSEAIAVARVWRICKGDFCLFWKPAEPTHAVSNAQENTIYFVQVGCAVHIFQTYVAELTMVSSPLRTALTPDAAAL